MLSSKGLVWSERMLGFEASGLTRRAWCLREGLSLAMLDYWRRRLRGSGSMRVAQSELGGVQLTPVLKSKSTVSKSMPKSFCDEASVVPMVVRDGVSGRAIFSELVLGSGVAVFELGGCRCGADASVDAVWLSAVLRGLV
jgi:hypothetical protein